MSRALLLPLALLSGCISPPPVTPADTSPLAVGESRVVALHAIRLDVTNFEQTLTKADILGLPPAVLESTWLMDLNLTGGSGRPLLMDNALHAIGTLVEDDPALSQAERNMVRLLQMTPDTADLRGTRLEELLELSPKVGFAPAQILADAMGIGVEDPFLASWALSEALVAGLLATHPRARTRPGAPTAAHPDGQIPVAAGHIPITLGDCANDMRTLAERFGPVTAGSEGAHAFHPGFIVAVEGASVMTDDFRMTLRASANALPFKGVDLGHAEVGNVTSIGRDEGDLFDFSDPDWLRLEGLVEAPKVGAFTFEILEYPEPVSPGTSPLPAPRGNGDVWLTPSWCIERLITEASFMAFATRTFSRGYAVSDDAAPLFTVDIEGGWLTLSTLGDVGSPPPPLYLWDLMGEVGQLRLHDGPDPSAPDVDRLAEGEANLRFTLEDVPLGLTTAGLRDAIRANLERDPTGLINAATAFLDPSWGAPDFYYFRPRPDAPDDVQGDWLFFVDASDIPDGSERDAADYAHPGFFGDEALSERISDTRDVGGDTTHQKLKLEDGDVVYIEDDEGARFRLDVGAKPSSHRISLTITRTR